MTELIIKLDVPSKFEQEFRLALARALKNLVIEIEFAIADAILSKSKLTDEQARGLADELKHRVAKRHGL